MHIRNKCLVHSAILERQIDPIFEHSPQVSGLHTVDVRERALARSDAGETVRSIAQALQISPSCVSKWKKLRRETGSLSPGKMNGHKKRVLSGPKADWLRERVRSRPFTLRQLTQELAARGIKTDVRAVWVFVHAEGLSFKKNHSAG